MALGDLFKGKKVKDVMTRNPDTCLASNKITETVRIMIDDNVGSVPIVNNKENNTLVGIVTDRDICLYVVGNDLQPSTVTVADVMTASPITCKEEDSLDYVINVMEDNQIRRIIVVDDSNSVIGIVAQADIVTKGGESSGKVNEMLEKISEPTSKAA